MQKLSLYASFGAIFANGLLTVLKLSAGVLSGSQALISDGINSLLDIVSAVIMFVAIRVGHKRPDHNHPFGHHRAEPIAALIIAIFANILGFEIIRDAVLSFFDRGVLEISNYTLFVVFFAIAFKIGMMFTFKAVAKMTGSTSIKAASIDFRNDILASSTVLVAVISAQFGMVYLDSVIAILIGLYVGYSGFQIARENIKFLMGEAPETAMLELIKAEAKKVSQVMDINHVSAQYIGSEVEIEININLDHQMQLRDAHAVADEVKQRLLTLPGVCHAFVHIDPV